jgi:hypothetical protein
MGKIIFTILLLSLNVNAFGQTICVFLLNNKEIKIEKYQSYNVLTIYNNEKQVVDSCYHSQEKEIRLYIDTKPMKINRKALKKYYTLSDFIAGKINSGCDFIAFKIGKKYYEEIEVQVEIDTAPPPPEE